MSNIVPNRAIVSFFDQFPADDPEGCADLRAPLIDYDRASGGKVMLHPYVAMSYAGSVPELQAEMNIWLVDLMRLGTVNPHHLKWTQEEYQRGLEMNRDDVEDLSHED